MRRLVAGDATGAADAFAPDGRLVVPFPEGPVNGRGRAEIAELFGIVLGGFGAIGYDLRRRYVLPDGLVEEATLTAEQAPGTAGQPARQLPLRVDARIRVRLDDDLIEEAEVSVDLPSLRHQLGATTAAGEASTLVADLRTQRAGVELIDVRRPAAADARPTRWWRTRAAGAVAAVLLAGLALVAVLATRGSHRTPRPSEAAAEATVHPTARPSSSVGLPHVALEQPKAAPTVQPGRQLVVSTDVLFAFDSASLTGQATAALRTLAAQVRAAHVSGTVQVNGYTDALGTPAYDVALSRARALAVARALAPLLDGVPVTLQPQGFGSADPVASNATGTGRAANRRVTVILPT